MSKSRKKKETEIRFWDKVNKTPGLGPDGDCWEWLAKKDPGGYGIFSLDATKIIRAHRYSYELHKGPIPEGMLIRHSCHNRKCVNPAHLEVGTAKENAEDMIKAGRANRAKGQFHPNTKFTPDQVITIREKYATGNYTQKQLAKEYVVSRECINNIVNNYSWSEESLNYIEHKTFPLPDYFSEMPPAEYIEVVCPNDGELHWILKSELEYKAARGISNHFHNNNCYLVYISKQADKMLEQRFWSRVQKSEDPDGCWIWTGVVRKNGHGLIVYKNTSHSAHRLIFEWSNGKIPEGKEVHRSCLNPSCVNPEHLYLGDHCSETKIKAGSQFNKLSISKCHEIIRLYKEGNTVYQLAKQFGVAISVISNVINGKYKSIISEKVANRNYNRGTDCYNSKFTEVQVNDIRRRGDNGEGPTSITKDYGNCSKSTIANITSRRNYRHVPEYPGSPWENGVRKDKKENE